VSSPRRIETLRALAKGAHTRIGSAVFVHVDHELQEISAVARVTPERRKHLLQVLHAARALETALKEIIRGHGVSPRPTLGGVLHQLASIPRGQPGYLAGNHVGRFGATVRDVRNRFAHSANAFPRSFRETEQFLDEIERCFALAVR